MVKVVRNCGIGDRDDNLVVVWTLITIVQVPTDASIIRPECSRRLLLTSSSNILLCLTRMPGATNLFKVGRLFADSMPKKPSSWKFGARS